MPNWCSNYIVFTGSKCKEALEWIQNNVSKVDNEGVQFKENVNESCIFDAIIDFESMFFSFQTRWAPAPEQIVFVADKFELDFEYDYSERDNLVEGKYVYKNKVLTDYALGKEDFDKIEYDDGEPIYMGEKWESEDELLETLIEEKIKKENKNTI